MGDAIRVIDVDKRIPRQRYPSAALAFHDAADHTAISEDVICRRPSLAGDAAGGRALKRRSAGSGWNAEALAAAAAQQLDEANPWASKATAS